MLLLCLFGLSVSAFAQPGRERVVDQVIAVVGNNIILLSDLEAQYQQMLPQTTLRGTELRCRILDQLLLNKLLLHHAGVDSVEVSEDQVEQKINQNLSYYIQQIGSVENLEKYYGKSVAELKDEFKPVIRDQMLIQQMQSKLTGSATASPADVRAFFESIPADSLPLINAELEYAQIIVNVPLSPEEKNKARTRLEEIRERILKGDDFSTLAVLYSQDKESAKQGGELGFVNRGDLVPQFEAAAFRLKNNTELSPIVESPYGYHIIQLIERRGERINCRHILIRPEVTAEDIARTQQRTDSLVAELKSGSIKFEQAAEQFSDDKDSKMNGGLVINSATGTTRFEPDQIDPMLLFQFDKMQPGDISIPVMSSSREGDKNYKILQLKSRTLPHRLNLKDDYQRIQELALSDKQNRILENWRNKKKVSTYINISEEMKSCPDINDWTINGNE